MNSSEKFTVVIAVCLFMTLTVISFFVFSTLSENNPLYRGQEFEVTGTLDGEYVEGTCDSSLNNHSGYGIIVQYSIELNGAPAQDLDFYLCFDDKGNPSSMLYSYDKTEGSWSYKDNGRTYTFYTNGPQKIDSLEIQSETTSLSLKEVIV